MKDKRASLVHAVHVAESAEKHYRSRAHCPMCVIVYTDMCRMDLRVFHIIEKFKADGVA